MFLCWSLLSYEYGESYVLVLSYSSCFIWRFLLQRRANFTEVVNPKPNCAVSSNATIITDRESMMCKTAVHCY
jgi:hypothetical protein